MMFINRPRISKHYIDKKKIIDVSVNGIKLNFEKIIKVLELFQFDNIIIITELEKNNKIFEELKNRKIRYTTAISKKENVYVETIIMIPDVDKGILNFIVKNDPEVIFIYNLKKSVTWDQILYNNKYLKESKSVNIIADLYFEFIFNENQIYASYLDDDYNTKILIEKINQILFEIK